MGSHSTHSSTLGSATRLTCFRRMSLVLSNQCAGEPVQDLPLERGPCRERDRRRLIRSVATMKRSPPARIVVANLAFVFRPEAVKARREKSLSRDRRAKGCRQSSLVGSVRGARPLAQLCATGHEAKPRTLATALVRPRSCRHRVRLRERPCSPSANAGSRRLRRPKQRRMPTPNSRALHLRSPVQLDGRIRYFHIVPASHGPRQLRAEARRSAGLARKGLQAILVRGARVRKKMSEHERPLALEDIAADLLAVLGTIAHPD